MRSTCKCVGLRVARALQVTSVRSLHMYIDRSVGRPIYIDGAPQCGIFGTCATVPTFTCAAIFLCLSPLTIDFPPNCFDYCEGIDNQLARMSRTWIHISIKTNGRWSGFLVL
jgi:hypothetical protein